MSQKETLIDLLETNGTMTQGALAELVYGDKKHSPGIYAALMALVNSGVVNRTGSNPAYYSLTDTDIIIPPPKSSLYQKKNTGTLRMMLLRMRLWKKLRNWFRQQITMVRRMN